MKRTNCCAGCWRLRAAGLVGGLGFALSPGWVSAQDTGAAADDDLIEEIVVTGSRIARRDFNSPSPISTVDRSDIEASAQATLEELLNRMPQLSPSAGRTTNNGSNGTSEINLRALGPGRNLVLLNSRRLAPSGVGSAVDVNNIPQALIERVEIITGGASTVYGSDAISGVVNFITRDDFRGLTIEAQYSVTGKGDADNYDFNLAYGTGFARDKGNVVAYAGYLKRSEVFAGARELTSQPFFEDTENGTIEIGGSPRTPAGVIVFPEAPFPDGPNWVTFNADGTPREFVDPDDYYNFQPVNYLQTPLERISGGLFGSYETGSGYEWYLETGYARNRSAFELAPVPGGGGIRINTDNPLLTPETRQLLEDVYLAEPGFAEMFFLKRMSDVGPRHSEFERDYWRTVLGIRGELGRGWDIDGWVTYTLSDEKQFLYNDVSISRFNQSLLADPVTGECFDPSNGCVPLDIFGPGSITPEAAAFVRVPTMTNTARRVQKLASFYVRGSPIDTWAGPVDIATGLEWRSDDGRYTADAGLFTGDTLGYRGDAPVDGTETVSEIYAEAVVPLLRDAPVAQDLTLEIGARYSKYRNAGRVETYKLGGSWQPADSIRFRIMGQRSVRAPNNYELFQEQFAETFVYIGPNSSDDPCSASADPAANDNVERCVIQGLPASEIGIFEATPFFPVEFVSGGNPDLRPEEANTLTAGTVLTPLFLPSWNFSIDYYRIELDGEIGTVSSDSICFDRRNTDYLFCDNIHRGPSGDVIEVLDLANNRGTVETSGIDVQATFSADLPSSWSLFDGNPQFGFSLIWTHVLLERRQENPVTTIIDCNGYFGSPCGNFNGTSPNNRLNATFSYNSGPFHAQLNSYWIEGMDSFRTVDYLYYGGDEPVLAIPRIGSKHYLNLNLAYEFTDRIRAALGIANLLDTDPPLLADNTFDGSNTDVATYDPFGRAFNVSVTMQFGGE